MGGVVLATIAIQLLPGHHVQTRPQLCAAEIIIRSSEKWNIKAEWRLRAGRSNPGSHSHPLLGFNDTLHVRLLLGLLSPEYYSINVRGNL